MTRNIHSKVSARKVRVLLVAFVIFSSVAAMPLMGMFGSGTATAATDDSHSLNIGMTESMSLTAQTSDEIVYSGSADTTVRAIDSDGNEIWQNARSAGIASVAESADESVVFAGGGTNVSALDADTGNEIWTSSVNSAEVRAVAPSPDDSVVYSGGTDHIGKALDADTGNVIWNHTFSNNVHSITASTDGSTVYMAGFGETKALYAENGTVKWENSEGRNAISLSPSGETVYTAFTDGTFRSYNASTGTFLQEYNPHTNEIDSLEASSDGSVVYATSPDGTASVSVSTGNSLWTNTTAISSVSEGDTGSVVYTAGSGDTVKALDASSGDGIWSFGGHTNVVTSVDAGATFGGLFEATTGQVTDQDGNPIGGATVTFTNVSTGSETVTETNSDGSFSISVESGRYEISISAEGYQTLTDTRDVSPGDELGTFQLAPQQLDLQFNRFVEPGDSTPYTVEFTDENGSTIDVTGNVTMNSSNTSIAGVDTNAVEIVGASDVNGTSVITANYTVGNDTYTDTRTVTVATKTVDNLEIIPGTWRFSALMDDITIQVILVAIGAAIVATRAASAWAGLGAMELVIIIGWFAGWVPIGIAMLGLFTALFIGLNLAANIDYSVRR